MARILRKKYDWEPDKTLLDWDSAPNPPDDYRRSLQWDHRQWHKRYNNTVLSREVREAYWDCRGPWPNFTAPELLEEDDFRKFCYLAELRQDACLKDIPRNYLPHDYRNKRELWEQQQYQEAQNRRRSRDSGMGAMLATLFKRPERTQEEEEEVVPLFVDEAGETVCSNDKIVLEGLSEKEFNGETGTAQFIDPSRPDHIAVHVPSLLDGPISFKPVNLFKIVSGKKRSATADSDHRTKKQKVAPVHISSSSTRASTDPTTASPNDVNLLDLPPIARDLVASYLTLFDVQKKLRPVCVDTFWNWKKPAPTIDYDFIYFAISDGVYHVWHGVAYTVHDMVKVIKWANDGEMRLSFQFVRFDRTQSIVPLLRFMDSAHRENDEKAMGQMDEIGELYCGVTCTKLQQWPYDIYSFVGGENWNDRDGDSTNDDLVHALRYCKDLTPREPRLNLSHDVGIKSLIRQKGDDDACMHEAYSCLFYCPKWFATETSFEFSAPTDASSDNKRVVVFNDVSHLWDKN
eukprot:CAMPEP_0194069886 /NCGR_PEP_ID=MMETSP0009_2-20130614/87880_1 /TAXON_ID=210454 /ORGANISM="Grammatophora oceanica, Strain CCMP 410" /LENGTH=516 /DNA_ID=CAMNT_0038723111 /DNA_START=133 /DNA_END=1683 /DNA_ORIENTATION=+